MGTWLRWFAELIDEADEEVERLCDGFVGLYGRREDGIAETRLWMELQRVRNLGLSTRGWIKDVEELYAMDALACGEVEEGRCGYEFAFGALGCE